MSTPLLPRDITALTRIPRFKIDQSALLMSNTNDTTSCPSMSTEASPAEFKMAAGQPCWIHIPAYDVARATKFYQEALSFHTRAGDASGSMAPEDITHFDFPGTPFASSLSGGIMARSKEERAAGQPSLPEKGKGVLYFYVDDLEGTMAKIEKAGGKDMTGREGGGGGWHADFRDTEGNFHGLYTMTPPPKKD